MSEGGYFSIRETLDCKKLLGLLVTGVSTILTALYQAEIRDLIDQWISEITGIPVPKVGYYVAACLLIVFFVLSVILVASLLWGRRKGKRVPNGQEVEKLHLEEAETSVREWLQADIPGSRIIAIDSSGGTTFTLGPSTFRGVGFHGVAVDKDDVQHDFEAIYNSETLEIVKREHRKVLSSCRRAR